MRVRSARGSRQVHGFDDSDGEIGPGEKALGGANCTASDSFSIENKPFHLTFTRRSQLRTRDFVLDEIILNQCSEGNTMFRDKTKALGRVAVAAALSIGLAVGAVSVASAVGTKANTITARTPPAAGSVRGSYTPSATATSGDKVAITLDATSTGCSLTGGKVAFTAAGTCLVDLNDAGNGAFAAASRVQQSIKVYSANTITASTPPAAGSAGGSYSPGASATSGDTVGRSLAGTSTGCSLSSNKVTFTGSGKCLVDFNDGGNGAFAAASQVRQSIKVYAANTITAATPPAAGTINGSYSPSATATSGDTVVITLAATSRGCSIDKRVVTFTANGVCLVDFNDVGNGAFAQANQVQQTIAVGTGNPQTQATLTLTSLRGTVGRTLTLTSQGGSGTGGLSYVVTSVGTAGCSISGTVLSATSAGTCTVTVTKAADATYAVAHSPTTTVTFTHVAVRARPHVAWLHGHAVVGKTKTLTIGGSGFYGRPRITSNEVGTRAVVSRDTGKLLTVRVTVRAGSRTGWHTFTIRLANGKSCKANYLTGAGSQRNAR